MIGRALRSLRWQIVMILFGIVLLTATIAWFLTVAITERDFEAYVREEALDQAREYAQLLEAQFNVLGSFDDLEEFLFETSGWEMFEEAAEEAWMSEHVLSESAIEDVEELDLIEWDIVIAGELDMSLAEYWDALEFETPAEMGESIGVSQSELVAAIMRQETSTLYRGTAERSESVYYAASILREVQNYVEEGELAFWQDVQDWEESPSNPALYDAEILVLDLEGRILFDGYSGEPVDSEDLWGELEALDWEVDGFPIRDWDAGQPIGYVLSARPPGSLDIEEAGFLDQARDGLLLGGAMAAAIALAIGLLVANRISKPIEALRESAEALARGDDVGRLAVTPGELGAMSAAFNAMADSIEQQREVRNRMTSDLSHELNTPLSVIQLELEALRDGMQTPEEAVSRVLSELDLLRNLASDVSLLAENEAGLLTIQRESVDLGDFLRAAAERWRTPAEAAGIKLTVTSMGAQEKTEMDPSRISQALGNLIRNALQHTQIGGGIEIRHERRPVEQLGGIWGVIGVHDSGSGIAEEALHHLFERKGQTARTKTGRGLGLMIVRQIVEAHGGHVWVESTVGVGSSFFIALP